MSATLTRAEIQADLDATDRDIVRLGVIVENISGFMRDSGGEDRTRYRTYEFHFEALLEKAHHLKAAITKKLSETPK